MTFGIVASPNFKKVLRKKPKVMQRAVAECLSRLASDPKHHSLQVHKMQGTDGVWEAYVDKGNRITFTRDGDVFTLLNNCNHDILRRP